MSIYVGGQRLKELYVGGQKIKEAWMGNVKIFPDDSPIPPPGPTPPPYPVSQYNYLIAHGNEYYASDDGIYWDTIPSPVGNILSINYVNSLFFLMGENGYTFSATATSHNWATLHPYPTYYDSGNKTLKFTQIEYDFNRKFYIAIYYADNKTDTSALKWFAGTKDLTNWETTRILDAVSNTRNTLRQRSAYSLALSDAGQRINLLTEVSSYVKTTSTQERRNIGYFGSIGGENSLFGAGITIYSYESASHDPYVMGNSYAYRSKDNKIYNLTTLHGNATSSSTHTYTPNGWYLLSSPTAEFLNNSVLSFFDSKGSPISGPNLTSIGRNGLAKVCFGKNNGLLYVQDASARTPISEIYISDEDSIKRWTKISSPIKDSIVYSPFVERYVSADGYYSTDGINWTSNNAITSLPYYKFNIISRY